MTQAAARIDSEQFATWMAEFRLDPADEALATRWEALSSLVKESTLEDLEPLVRLALRWRQAPTAAAVDQIVAHFAAEDSRFSAASNARELQVLAAITLVRIANAAGHALAPAAALMLATSLSGNARKINLPLDLQSLGESALHALSNGQGRRPPLPTRKSIPPFDFDAAALAASQQNWAQVNATLKASGTAASSAITLLAGQLSSVVKVLHRIQEKQDEELQMLWWLIGGRSEILDAPFDTISGPDQALVLGAELAEHTVLPPGPSSATALLARAGLKSKGKVGVAKAIAACQQSWLSTLVEGHDVSPVTLPIHFGIQRQLEVGVGDEWVANWAAASSVRPDWTMSPLGLGTLFYRERLLIQMY